MVEEKERRRVMGERVFLFTSSKLLSAKPGMTWISWNRAVTMTTAHSLVGKAYDLGITGLRWEETITKEHHTSGCERVLVSEGGDERMRGDG